MCLPKKTLIQYKNAIKEVKQKLKTVELEWQNLDEAVKKDFVNVELYKSDKLSYYDWIKIRRNHRDKYSEKKKKKKP